ncbi:hypothetical protein FRC12_010453 [Ceratobasidium sp. 428]|nr:hypothetical protein FRC12_010453 [Ceratobasidium sp. 428]
MPPTISERDWPKSSTCFGKMRVFFVHDPVNLNHTTSVLQAADQFEDVTHGRNLGTQLYSSRGWANMRRSRNSPRATRPSTSWTNDLEELPTQMEGMATDLNAFLKQL